MKNSREIDRAVNVSRETYPINTECAVCGMIWGAHSGEICPICSVCHQAAAAHVASCSICTAAHNSLQMCAQGQDLAKRRHGLSHTPDPQNSIEIEIREGDPRRWSLCRAGVTTFLPLLDPSAMQFDA